MKFTATLAAVASVCTLAAQAAPSARGAWPSMPASEIHSYSLWAWGPLQKSGGSADLVDLDPGLESAETISSLKAQGKRVVCYIDAGTLEDWRSDRSSFHQDQSVEMAKQYKGFGGTEQWFDIMHWEALKEPMGARIANAAAKGCQGVELDNTDCFENMCVAGATYDQLLAKEIEYVQWLADTAHAHGMAVGLKNSLELINSVFDKVDFAINEQCQQFGSPKSSECASYSRFAQANKAVLGVEYDNNDGRVCSVASQYKMVTMYRDGGDWKNCF